MALILSQTRLRLTQAKFFGNPQLSGSVTQLTEGYGITLTPNPITALGTIELDSPLPSDWAAGNVNINSRNSTNWFNVLAYGADPTGAADSTASFQAAIDAATAQIPSRGGVIYIPTGYYTLASTLVLNTTTSNTGIIFQGDGTTGNSTNQGTILTLNTTTAGFDITQDTGATVQFRDLTLTTIGAANATGGAFIYCHSTANFPLVVERCKFIHHFNGIQLNSNWYDSRIEGCDFNTSAPLGTDVWIDNLVHADQGGTTIFRNTFASSCQYCIRQTAGGGTSIVGNGFASPGGQIAHVYLDLPAGKATSDLLIQGNGIEGVITGANIVLAPGGFFRNILIQNNEFMGTPGKNAIYIAPSATGNANNGQITGNSFYNTATHVNFDPAAAGGAHQWNVSENLFDSPTTAAIQLQGVAGGTTNLTVGCNNFISSGNSPYVNGAFDASSGFFPAIETLFTQTAVSTTTANTLTTLFGTGRGSLTIPAGRLMVGTQIRLRLRGYVSQADGGATTHIITLYLGGVSVATFTTASATNPLNAAWNLDATITCYTAGAGGTVWGNFTGLVSGANNMVGAATATAAANTPVPLLADIKYNNQNATGVLTTTESSMEILS